jgi:hypothetical protein
MSDIFVNDWRNCLQAHYMQIVRDNDLTTLETLQSVMVEVGFQESDLKELYVMATAHVDDVAHDFVPDLEILSSESYAKETPNPTKDEPEVPKQLSLF